MGQPTNFPSVCSCTVAWAKVRVGVCGKCCKRALHPLLLVLCFWAECWKGGKILWLLDFSLICQVGQKLWAKWRNEVRTKLWEKKNEHKKVHLSVFDPGEWEELESWRARGDGPWKCPYQLLFLGSRPHSCPQDHHHQNPTADPCPVEPSNLP